MDGAGGDSSGDVEMIFIYIYLMFGVLVITGRWKIIESEIVPMANRGGKKSIVLSSWFGKICLAIVLIILWPLAIPLWISW